MVGRDCRRGLWVAVAAAAAVLSGCGGSTTDLARASIASASFVVTTDFAPPADGPFTTSFTTSAQVKHLEAALAANGIRLTSSAHGSIANCSGGDSISVTVQLLGGKKPLKGASDACGSHVEGTVSGNVFGLIEQLNLAHSK
jgi:hypothetical protein